MWAEPPPPAATEGSAWCVVMVPSGSCSVKGAGPKSPMAPLPKYGEHGKNVSVPAAPAKKNSNSCAPPVPEAGAVRTTLSAPSSAPALASAAAFAFAAFASALAALLAVRMPWVGLGVCAFCVFPSRGLFRLMARGTPRPQQVCLLKWPRGTTRRTKG